VLLFKAVKRGEESEGFLHRRPVQNGMAGQGELEAVCKKQEDTSVWERDG